jgi:hypothetical protein
LKDEIADIPLSELSIDDYQAFQDRITKETLPDRFTTAIRVLEAARCVALLRLALCHNIWFYTWKDYGSKSGRSKHPAKGGSLEHYVRMGSFETS